MSHDKHRSLRKRENLLKLSAEKKAPPLHSPAPWAYRRTAIFISKKPYMRVCIRDGRLVRRESPVAKGLGTGTYWAQPPWAVAPRR